MRIKRPGGMAANPDVSLDESQSPPEVIAGTKRPSQGFDRTVPIIGLIVSGLAIFSTRLSGLLNGPFRWFTIIAGILAIVAVLFAITAPLARKRDTTKLAIWLLAASVFFAGVAAFDALLLARYSIPSMTITQIRDPAGAGQTAVASSRQFTTIMVTGAFQNLSPGEAAEIYIRDDDTGLILARSTVIAGPSGEGTVGLTVHNVSISHHLEVIASSKNKICWIRLKPDQSSVTTQCA